ncbi:hypothetical protein ACVWZK_000203 [Bradyrhizobium sp. GM0.4]
MCTASAQPRVARRRISYDCHISFQGEDRNVGSCEAYWRFAAAAPKQSQSGHSRSYSTRALPTSTATEKVSEGTDVSLEATAAGNDALPDTEGYVFGPKFDALRCAIYHVARRNFFDLSNRLLNFLVIVLGAGVAGKAAKLIHFEEGWLEFGVLIFATAQLTFDFGYRARTHEFLQKKYNDMLAEIELDPKPSEKRYNAKLFTIAGDEPMPLRALDALAYNAALDATTSDPEMRSRNRVWIPPHQRVLRHFIAFHAYEYKLESERVSIWKKLLGRSNLESAA